MKKSELLSWLQGENQQWEAFLDQIDPARMDEAGVAAHWSIKDIVAHLTGWNHRLVANLQAIQRSEPEPPPPWPAHLQTDDAVNDWIYTTNRDRSVHDVRTESRHVFQQILTVVAALPDDVRIETVHHAGREYYLVWIGEQRIQPGEFFDHFHDDHESDIRAWLERTAQH